MPEEEQKYTLLEAQRLLGRRECMVYGHEFDQMHADGKVVKVWCPRCSAQFVEVEK